MKIEEQLADLAIIGLRLNKGLTVDELLYSFDREDYENKPFDLLLFVLGIEVEREPWGRRFSSCVWNFDAECIVETGDYVEIAKNLTRIAGTPNLLNALTDFVDLEAGTAWLSYTVRGTNRHWVAQVDDDWADPELVTNVMTDIESDGNKFYGIDNGQSTIVFYLLPDQASRLQKLIPDILHLLVE